MHCINCAAIWNATRRAEFEVAQATKHSENCQQLLPHKMIQTILSTFKQLMEG